MVVALRGFRGFVRLFVMRPQNQKNLGSVCKLYSSQAQRQSSDVSHVTVTPEFLRGPGLGEPVVPVSWPRGTPVTPLQGLARRQNEVLVPCLSFQNLSTATRTETINANMTLRLTSKQPLLCEAQGVVSSREHSNPVRDNTAPTKGHNIPATTRVEAVNDANARQNPLVVVLAWMKAKDAHLQRYHDLYMDQGFDILTVKTDPMQLAFPTNKGSQYIAQMVLDFLLNNPNYARLVVHAFSVGGYQMGEILVRMRKGGSRYLDLAPRFKAQVYDSLVDYTGIPTGFPTALTKSQFLRKVLEIMIRVQSVIMYPMSTVHYKAASRAFHDNPLMCPALMINSKEDQVSGLEDNIRVADCWRKKGLDVAFCTFDDSKHVQHMGKYPDQYVNEVLRLLRKVQLAA